MPVKCALLVVAMAVAAEHHSQLTAAAKGDLPLSPSPFQAQSSGTAAAEVFRRHLLLHASACCGLLGGRAHEPMSSPPLPISPQARLIPCLVLQVPFMGRDCIHLCCI